MSNQKLTPSAKSHILREMDRKRILRAEIGGFRKQRGKLSVCLVYPNTYEVGMANLGFQLVYKTLNQMEEVVCERSFMDTDFSKSLESGTKLSEFDILAFSLSYELDFLNILKALRVAHIPPYSEERNGLPILILGGVAAFANPLPYSPFFDLIYIGEAEQTLDELIDLFKKYPQRQVFLDNARRIEGLWVPDFGQKRTRRVLVEDLNQVETSAVCVSPLTHFKNMLLVEVERGCPFGCRFCLASQAYSPYRVKNPSRIVEEVVCSQIKPRSIGLIGTAISEFPDLPLLIQKLSGFTETIGVSSLRLDRVDRGLLKTLVEVGLKTITIAPEAGSERLRCIINKRIKDENVLKLGTTANRLKVKRIKLYFMVGLPFETEEDVVAIIDLIQEFRKVYEGELVISVNPFVPKAHTPFQYHRMEAKKMLGRKISFVREQVRKIGKLKLIAKSPREALFQAIMSRGDAALGKNVLTMVDEGIGWETAFKKGKIDIDEYLGERPTDSVLPWEFIDFGADTKSLVRSYNQAKKLAHET